MRRQTVQLTTAADGTVTGFTRPVEGELHAIHYVKGDFADGVDFTITDEVTGETLWTEANVNASKVVYPRAATHSTDGVAALYAAGGAAVLARPALARTKVKIQIAQGGNAKSGTFHVLVA